MFTCSVAGFLFFNIKFRQKLEISEAMPFHDETVEHRGCANDFQQRFGAYVIVLRLKLLLHGEDAAVRRVDQHGPAIRERLGFAMVHLGRFLGHLVTNAGADLRENLLVPIVSHRCDRLRLGRGGTYPCGATRRAACFRRSSRTSCSTRACAGCR